MKTGTSFAELFVVSHDAYKEVCATLDVAVKAEDPAVEAMVEDYKARLKSWQHMNLNMATTADATDHGVVDVRELAAAHEGGDKNKHFLILPYDKIHRFWEPCLFISVFFMFLMVPIRSVLYVTDWKYAKPPKMGPSADWTLLLEYFLDAFFVVDMYLRAFHFARRGIVGGEEALIVDPWKICGAYARTFRFKVDCVANFPWLLVAAVLTHATDGAGNGMALGPAWWAAMRYRAPRGNRCLRDDAVASTPRGGRADAAGWSPPKFRIRLAFGSSGRPQVLQVAELQEPRPFNLLH